MDDILVPMALALATAVLTHMAHGVVSAAARHWALRGRDRWRESRSVVRE